MHLIGSRFYLVFDGKLLKILMQLNLLSFTYYITFNSVKGTGTSYETIAKIRARECISELAVIVTIERMKFLLTDMKLKQKDKCRQNVNKA